MAGNFQHLAAFLKQAQPETAVGHKDVLHVHGKRCGDTCEAPFTFQSFATELSRIAAVSTSGVPMRAPQFFRIGSGHQIANRPLASPFTPQFSFMWEGNFVASRNRSLSLRPSGLPAVPADQTKGNSEFGLRRLLSSQLADTGSPRYQWDMLRHQTENCAGGTSTRKFNS